ncbi:MAG: alpha/beta hydrolase [Steroidobacteraceae bacterium]
MKKIALSLAIVALILYAGVCFYLYFAQRSLIYFPTPEMTSNDATAMRMQTHGALLKVWQVERPGPRAVIYFGGNADNVGVHVVPFSHAITDRSLYFVNYRGYGGSTGNPSERHLFADAVAVFDHVQRLHPQVAVIGRSLGSGVAAYLATQRPVEKLILVTPYDSIERVAQGYYRWFPIFLILKDRFNTLGRVSKISMPTLIVIAEDDEVIPRPRTDTLVAAFPKQQVEVKVLPGVSHNLEDETQSYLDAMRDFLAR